MIKAAAQVSKPFLSGFLLAFLVTFSVQSIYRWTHHHAPAQSLSGKSPFPYMDEIHVHGGRKSVFIGIMTTLQFLPTRAVAGAETFLAELPENYGYSFFVPEGGGQVLSNVTNKLNVIELKGVDDTYPPQKKSLAMISAMWTLYGEKFDWFVRLDDDAYLRHSQLTKLLRSFDPSRAYLLGQGATGRKEEAGKLFLGPGENYCMGGTGVIMSRETLRQVAPHVRSCAKNLRTFHEDIELSRCIREHTIEKISCPRSSEMKILMRHDYGGKKAFAGDLTQMKDLERAIVLHPLKEEHLFYKMHRHFMKMDLLGKHDELAALSRDLKAVKKVMESGASTFEDYKREQSTSLRIDPANLNTSSWTDLPALWEFIADGKIYSAGDDGTFPRRSLDSLSQLGLDNAIRQLVSSIDDVPPSRQRRLRRTIEFRRLVYAYRRHSPRLGVDYVLDVLMIYRRFGGLTDDNGGSSSKSGSRRRKIPVRRHSYVRMPFLEMQVWEKTLPERLPKVNFVVPLKGRLEVFRRFLNNWNDVCPREGGGSERRCTLTVVYYHEPNQPSSTDEKNIVEHLTSRLNTVPSPSTTPTPAEVRLVTVSDRRFSRGEALEIGAATAKPDDLLFLIDVDIVVSQEAVDRVRLNTQLGRSVWFPVTFSEYDPSFIQRRTSVPAVSNLTTSNDNGFWRIYGFGIVGIFKADLDAVGGFDRSISGWGKEDVDLYDKVAKSKSLSIVRAPDPGLVHVFHNITCDPRLAKDQLKMCLGTKATALASLEVLHEVIRKEGIF